MKEVYFTLENIFEQSQVIIEHAERYSAGRKFEFNPQKACLLLTDMQEFFFNPGSHAYVPSSSAIIPQIKKLIDICLNFNIPVITTQHQNTKEDASNMLCWWKRTLSPDNEYAGIIKEIKKYNLPLIRKSQYDAFYETNLQEKLQELNKSQLIICGVMTNLCCETTCRSAFVRGYQTFFPVDTTAAYNLDMHQSTFNNIAYGFAEAMLSSTLIKLIK